MSATVKVVLKKSGKLIGEAEVSETKSKVTAGKGSGVDLHITSDGLPDSFPILMIHQEKTFLAFPQVFQAQVFSLSAFQHILALSMLHQAQLSKNLSLPRLLSNVFQPLQAHPGYSPRHYMP